MGKKISPSPQQSWKIATLHIYSTHKFKVNESGWMGLIVQLTINSETGLENKILLPNTYHPKYSLKPQKTGSKSSWPFNLTSSIPFKEVALLFPALCQLAHYSYKPLTQMEAAPLCFNMKMIGHRRRKKYQRLRREDSDIENVKKGSCKNGVKISKEIILAMEPLRKCRDAYMKMVFYLAQHVQKLNNENVHLFKRIHKPYGCFQNYEVFLCKHAAFLFS